MFYTVRIKEFRLPDMKDGDGFRTTMSLPMYKCPEKLQYRDN